MTAPDQPEHFIRRHGLWSDAQEAMAAEVQRRVEVEGIRLVRLAWTDTHGQTRAKAVTPAALRSALTDGYNINVATWTLDASGGRVFASFTSGGGMGLAEMTGSPNIVAVPDPASFRTLPWAPGIGWMLCDPYFRDGRPFHFGARHVLRRQVAALAEQGLQAIVGLEVEWYLLRLAQEGLDDENLARPGQRPLPPATVAPEPGFSYHSEANMDLMQPVLSALADAYAATGLPLRSVENEWGAGQVECTFDAREALQAADDFILFRSATRQVCRRHGHLASFMCSPGAPSQYPSGWHLHLSLVQAAGGANLFTPAQCDRLLSPLGRAFVGGLLAQAAPALVFATPTVNGYRRFRVNSLAPDRAHWGHDNRGTMLRVLGGPGDPATRLENRVGEPAANPYLFIAAQILCGLDGLRRETEPPPPSENPYQDPAPALPTSLHDALAALERSSLFRDGFGEVYLDYFLKLKRAELARYDDWLAATGVRPEDGVTEWERREYLDAF
ncbi:glutamine synthetase family protein [Marinibaculum pumilum]|uniref:Glutamine synthetase family protein n=1 Tax=Marinibaculum pumilum TaxID=1766165 RepID=A0ABV7L7D3_9PROT